MEEEKRKRWEQEAVEVSHFCWPGLQRQKDLCKHLFSSRVMSLVFSADPHRGFSLVMSGLLQASCDGQQSVFRVLSSYRCGERVEMGSLSRV